MFRNFALVMLALTATALWASNADARGRRCGGGCGGGGCSSGGCGGGYCGGGGCGSGGCGYSGGCGAGGCGAGGCGVQAGCASCAAPGCASGQCPIGGGYAAAPVQAPGYIVVSLPANAQLSIDSKLTTATSETRTFVTPQLEPGYVYTYTLSAAIVRDGKVETVTQKVSVTAGQELKVSLTTPAEAVAAK